MSIGKIFKHFILIIKHKYIIFKLCCKAGIPWRGLVHDLSKFSPTEFFESAKYYVGNHSPITERKKDVGYSDAWLHHKGRNKHHHEYWVDEQASIKTPVIPYKYAVEMVCDKMAAGIVYKKKEWYKEYQLEYWHRESKKFETQINAKTKEFITQVFIQVAKEGINKTYTKKNMKNLYTKYCKE